MLDAQPVQPATKSVLDRDPLRTLVRVEHLAFGALLLALAWSHLGGALWWFLLWLAFPDVISLGPLGLVAMTRGRRAVGEIEADAQGLLTGEANDLPRWFPPIYNAGHWYVVPLVVIGAYWALNGAIPWALSGWLLHIAADRTLGYTLRRSDGSLS